MRDHLASRLASVLGQHGAARIGETAVLSTKVHVQSSLIPDEITASRNGDAGRVFYGRDKEGEILHLDVFHSPGILDPKMLGSRITAALVAPGEAPSPAPCDFDIQTAGGGGRLDGDLTYGMEQKARQVHSTHVHVACRHAPEHVARMLDVVQAIESSALDSGLGLRKVGSFRVTDIDIPDDLSEYVTRSDSRLRQEADIPEGLCQSLARALVSEAGSVKGLMEALQRVQDPNAKADGPGPGWDRSRVRLRHTLTKMELVSEGPHRSQLTREGRAVLEFLRANGAEMESYLRRLFRSLPSGPAPQPARRGASLPRRRSLGRDVTAPLGSGEIAVPETIAAWATRTMGANRPFHPSDLRFAIPKTKASLPIILLVDASASMSGRRMEAAKEVARHLALRQGEKTAMVAFQDTYAQVVFTFTKDHRIVEGGLRRVMPMGLTPLAQGLEAALDLAVRHGRKHLILLITDGIPTVSLWTVSPMEDGLRAAERIARARVRFGCVGLAPDRTYLEKLAEAGKGALYVLGEIESGAIASIARKESAFIHR